MTNNEYNLPAEGMAELSLGQSMERRWMEQAGKAGVDLSDFDPKASLMKRIMWALSQGLLIAVLYTRFSTKFQGSTEDQARPCFLHAAQNNMYLPPELWCADEAVKGSKRQRLGLQRLEMILELDQIQVALFFKLSRLSRRSYEAIKFIRERIVDADKRAVVVSQAIDTADKKTWRLQVGLHSMMDEELLDAIADHVREGLNGLFLKGWTTGALPIGYLPQEVSGAPPTRRKYPRMAPAIDENAAELIRLSFERVVEGMSISEAWRRYREAGGPVDPRSTTGKMSREAFHRMLRRPAYIGIWEFGRKRNEWSAKRDSIVQKVADENEIKVVRSEELRIVSDELFFKVQKRLDGLKSGPRGPRKNQQARLWQLVTEVFFCPHCDRRMYTCGAKGNMVRCPNPDCPKRGMLNREKAVNFILKTLQRLILRDAVLVADVIQQAQQRDQSGDENLLAEIADIEKRITSLNRKISDLHDMAGQGSDEDRTESKRHLRSAQTERGALQAQLSTLKASLQGVVGTMTPAAARQHLTEISELLKLGAADELGRDAIHKAVDAFKQLVGNRVDVHIEGNPGHGGTLVRGEFSPDLLSVVTGSPTSEPLDSTVLWLRPPARVNALAAMVAHFYERREFGFRRITKLINACGMKIGCGNVYQCYGRFYELTDRPIPPRRPRGRQSST